MSGTFVMVADLKNPDTGLTYREENNAMTHKIPLDTLVEVIGWEGSKHTGLRGFVCDHGRDCDGTPLYSISFDRGFRLEGHEDAYKHYFRAMACHGFAEDGLKIIKTAEEVNRES